MKKLYEKSEQTFAIIWIVIYCVLQSLANLLNEKTGIEYSASAIFCIVQATVLFVFITHYSMPRAFHTVSISILRKRYRFNFCFSFGTHTEGESCMPKINSI